MKSICIFETSKQSKTMIPDIISPTKGISEYKSELIKLLDRQAVLLNCAMENAKKGFRFSAEESLSQAESLGYDISFCEEMIEKLKVKAVMGIV